MRIIIEHISFSLFDTTTKESRGKDCTCDKLEVHYLAFPSQKHEIRGMITVPYNEHIYLPEIIRQIGIEIKFNP